MRTIKISDGDLDVDEPTGVVNTVDGINKGAQDVARHILSEFDAFFQEGNEIFTFELGNTMFTESLISQFLTASVNRLIVKQGSIDPSDRIVRVSDVKVRRVGISTAVFLVEVLFGNNTTASIVDQVPLALNQLVDPGPFIKL